MLGRDNDAAKELWRPDSAHACTIILSQLRSVKDNASTVSPTSYFQRDQQPWACPVTSLSLCICSPWSLAATSKGRSCIACAFLAASVSALSGTRTDRSMAAVNTTLHPPPAAGPAPGSVLSELTVIWQLAPGNAAAYAAFASCKLRLRWGTPSCMLLTTTPRLVSARRT